MHAGLDGRAPRQMSGSGRGDTGGLISAVRELCSGLLVTIDDLWPWAFRREARRNHQSGNPRSSPHRSRETADVTLGDKQRRPAGLVAPRAVQPNDDEDEPDCVRIRVRASNFLSTNLYVLENGLDFTKRKELPE